MDTRHTRRFSILVGDDDVAVRDAVVAALAQRQLEVFTAQSGADALRVLCCRPIDLSILDVEMPGMTGPEVLRRYLSGSWIAGEGAPPERRERHRRMPTIFMSGTRDLALRQACDSLGDSFLDKPFGADAMRAAVDRIIARLAN